MKKQDLEKLSDGELSLAILQLKTGGLGDNYRVSSINSTARCLVSTGGFGSVTKSFSICNKNDMWDLIESDGNLDFLLAPIKCGDKESLRESAITYLLAHNIEGYK